MKLKRHVRRSSALLALMAMFAVVGGGGGAASGASGTKAPDVTPQGGGCVVNFANAGPPALTACVTGDGTISSLRYSFSGANPEHFASGTAFDGYCLRDTSSGTAYYDIGGGGSTGESGWGVATQTSTDLTTNVVRTTTDGLYTLTQNIFFKYGARLVLVGNKVTNNDTVSHTVSFGRFGDFDVNGGNTTNSWDAAGGSVWAKQTDGVALTSMGNPALVSAIGAGASFGALMTCIPSFVPLPATGDLIAQIQHQATIAPGATVTFRVGYRLL